MIQLRESCEPGKAGDRRYSTPEKPLYYSGLGFHGVSPPPFTYKTWPVM